MTLPGGVNISKTFFVTDATKNKLGCLSLASFFNASMRLPRKAWDNP